jgi:hypothetical protein
MICPTGKAKYFCERDSTRPKPLDEVICPSGSFPFVITGLDPVIHLLWKKLSRRMMDARIPATPRLPRAVLCWSAEALAKAGKSGHDECYRFALRAFVLFLGTLSPSALASERPIAIACLRLVTFLPERPLFRFPALRFFMARSTLADAFFEYFRAIIALPVAEK